MPKTTWRPYPNTFIQAATKFDNAAMQRQRVIEYMRSVGKPVTVKQVAKALGIGGHGYYGKARRYMLPVADATHEIHKDKDRPDLGWTLKEEYQ